LAIRQVWAFFKQGKTMTEMMDRVRLALVEVLQNSGLPVGTYIDTEALANAAIGEIAKAGQSCGVCGRAVYPGLPGVRP
jgi:hypothetical protein